MTRSHQFRSLLCGTIAAVLTFIGCACVRAADQPRNIRIIYSNDTYGYLEACGCGGANEGGLARRATLISRLVKENPNCLIIDSGNIASSKINLGIIAELMAGMGYSEIGVGRYDMVMLDDLLKHTGRHKITVLDALLPESKYVAPYRIRNIGGVKVGIISFGCDGCKDFRIQMEAEKAFCSAFQKVRKACDVLIMLDQGQIGLQPWLVQNEKTLGLPDIIIGGFVYSDFPLDVTVLKTHIVPTSSNGRKIGVIDIEVNVDHSLRIKKQMMVVDSAVPEDKAVQRKIDTFLTGLGFQTQSRPTSNVQAQGRNTYTSPETCKSCHAEEYEQWCTTKHAHAVRTLASKKRLIADCLPCHSEEYRQTSNVTNAVSPNAPLGVECATCHASVLPHSSSGPAKSVSRKVNPELCLSCHNSERSRNYDEKSYMPKIIHSK